MIDPVVAQVCSLAGAAVFLSGAYGKWRERELFAAAVEAYDLIPSVAVPTVSTLLIVVETAVGLALLLPVAMPHAQLGGLALLGLVTVAVVINLLRGRSEISCGCGGASGDQQLSWGLVARNIVLALALLAAALPVEPRALVALDYATLVLGVLMLAGLYAAASQLLANHPRLWALRNS